MPAWIPIVKTALPYIAQILSVAIPAFTRKPDSKATDDVIPKQIAELQNAATQNAESIQALAVQMQETVQSIDRGAVALQKEISYLKRLVWVAVFLAVISNLVIIWLVAV